MTHFREECKARRLYKIMNSASEVLNPQDCKNNCLSTDWGSWLEEVFSGDTLTTVQEKAAGVGCGTS